MKINVMIGYKEDERAKVFNYETETKDFEVALEEARIELGKDKQIKTIHMYIIENSWNGGK